jgi:hypothetical protein
LLKKGMPPEQFVKLIESCEMALKKTHAPPPGDEPQKIAFLGATVAIHAFHMFILSLLIIIEVLLAIKLC